MIIEVARSLAGLEGANSREFDTTTRYPVVDLMDDQHDVVDKGGTMRLGSYGARLLPGSQVAKAYETEMVSERHRHRYEVESRDTAAASRRSGWSARASRPTVGWSSSSSCPTTRSGSVPRPTRSSRAGPTGPTRSSGSWSAPPWPGPRAGIPDCSTSVTSMPSADQPPRDRDAWGPAIWRSAGGRSPSLPPDRRGAAPDRMGDPATRASFVGPAGEPFERDVVRHPGAVAVVAITDDRHVVLVEQYRAGGRPVAPRAAGRHLRCRRRAGSPDRRTASLPRRSDTRRRRT